MKKLFKYLLLFLAILFLILAIPEIFHKNQGKSKSIGTVGKGKLENPYLLPYRGSNFSYFSPLSYYLLDDAYVHHKVHKTVLNAYEICEVTCPETKFRLMECSNKDGGPMWIHRTHQNGLSIDFMIPKKKNERQSKILDRLGMWHYLLEFSSTGKSNLDSNIELDFETMGKHILALDEAAKKNGLRIKMVILKINLKDDFFKTASGKKVKARGIYFAQSLPKLVDDMHDEHYHVDFAFR